MENNLSNTTNTTARQAYSIPQGTIDEAVTGEVVWDNRNWTTNLGYYQNIPELKQAFDSLSTWVAGKGYTCEDSAVKVSLEGITGWGEDTFDSIMMMMIIIKKINGDAYAEIIRNGNKLVNLKMLNPSRMRTVVNDKGIIIRYEWTSPDGKTTTKKFKPEEIFHITNNRIANEIHGTSVIDSCGWIIKARAEVMQEIRNMMWRSSVRVIYVDMDNPAKLNDLKVQWKTALDTGQAVLLPGRKGQDVEVVDYPTPPIDAYLKWAQYLEDNFYRAAGVPKVILGGSDQFTEASSKVGYLTFEQVYSTEQRLLEQDLWNQLYIRVSFNRPVSLKDNIQESEAANTGQLSFQPNEMMTSMSRTE